LAEPANHWGGIHGNEVSLVMALVEALLVFAAFIPALDFARVDGTGQRFARGPRASLPTAQ
jgi:hypothetical protein